MANHIADKGEQDQLALATSAETTGARISPVSESYPSLSQNEKLLMKADPSAQST